MINLSKLAENFNIDEKYTGSVKTAEPMSDHTTFKVGGPAAVFLEPENQQSLSRALTVCHNNGIRPFILGGGSNLVVNDTGIDGVVISLGKMRSIEIIEGSDGYCLRCAGGTPINEITAFCVKQGYTGLETFSGLPGTIGGAAFMNARCYEVQISDVLVSAEYLPLEGELPAEPLTYQRNAADWDYKRSPFAENLAPAVVTAVVLKISRGDSAEIAAASDRYRRDRIDKGHFRYPSAGSVFKNNRSYGKPSGRIIDEAGLKGLSAGGAQVAPWHGNFIINRGDATAADIGELVRLVQQKVREQFGYELEPEILFI